MADDDLLAAGRAADEARRARGAVEADTMTSTDRLVARASAIAARAAAKAAQEPVSRSNTVACPDCLDRNWEDLGDGTMAPCRQCAPVTYRRWREGHYVGPDPCSCEECSLHRQGQLKVGRDVDPVTGLLRPGVLSSD